MGYIVKNFLQISAFPMTQLPPKSLRLQELTNRLPPSRLGITLGLVVLFH